MSQHRGGPMARQTKSDRPARPSLERPSLFAGMEDEDVDAADGGPQRVRILSTLASTRRPAKGPMKIDGIGITRKRRGAWQTRALVGAMMLGVLALLAGFVMVLIDGRAASGHDAAAQPPASAEAEHVVASTAARMRAPSLGGAALQEPAQAAATDNPLAALITPAPHVTPTQPPAQAAVIENVPMAPAATVTGKPAATATAALAAPAPVAGRSQGAAAPLATTSVAAIPVQHAARAMGPAMAEAKKPGRSVPQNRVANTVRRDEDVALLEAMFAHTGARQAPLSAADELKKRCGGLSGADAATCRARICVQHPTAAVCHTDP